MKPVKRVKARSFQDMTVSEAADISAKCKRSNSDVSSFGSRLKSVVEKLKQKKPAQRPSELSFTRDETENMCKSKSLLDLADSYKSEICTCCIYRPEPTLPNTPPNIDRVLLGAETEYNVFICKTAADIFRLIATKQLTDEVFLNLTLNHTKYTIKSDTWHEIECEQAGRKRVVVLSFKKSNEKQRQSFQKFYNDLLDFLHHQKSVCNVEVFYPPGYNYEHLLQTNADEVTETEMVMMGEGERITRGEAVELANQLAQVIGEGNVEKAKEIAATLASHRVKLQTEVIKPDKKEEPELSVRVYVEDKESSGASITLAVRPSDTVALLKKQVERMYNFPMAVQNWIIGLRMPRDTETLRQCGVRQPGHVMFLYLVSCRSVGLTKEAYLQQQQPPPAPCGAAEPRSIDAVDDQTRDSTYMSMDHHLRGVGRARPQSQGDVPAWEGRQPAVPPGPEAGPPSLPRRPPPQRNVTPAPQSLPQPARSAPVTTQPVGWACPKCTLINIPTRPGCAVCGESRPTNYRVPENVELPEEEQERLQRESQLDRQAKDVARRDEEALRATSQENYLQLLEASQRDIVTNTKPFECLICYDLIPPGEGVVLRECLHTFCRQCLESAIEYTEEVPLRCPYQDDLFSCDGVLQEREIRELVENATFERYLQRSLQTAESQAANSYHCQTRDCQGWCIYEDFSNFFHCPVCSKTNCLTCKAIHEEMNCKEYQQDIRIRAENDVAAKQTQILVQKLLTDGEAMHCPQCQVIVQKKEGCDWLRCSICKTEICWVTKGPRWGPLGEGDITGGCRCRVSGEKCHPQCNNCH